MLAWSCLPAQNACPSLWQNCGLLEALAQVLPQDGHVHMAALTYAPSLLGTHRVHGMAGGARPTHHGLWHTKWSCECSPRPGLHLSQNVWHTVDTDCMPSGWTVHCLAKPFCTQMELCGVGEDHELLALQVCQCGGWEGMQASGYHRGRDTLWKVGKVRWLPDSVKPGISSTGFSQAKLISVLAEAKPN